MKKIFYIFVLLLCITSVSNAQKLLPFSPSLQLLIKGGYSTPLSGGTYSNSIENGGNFADYFKAFPGGQIEAVVNLSSSFGIYGNASYDIIAPKEQRGGVPYSEDNAAQFSLYAGPRYYYDIPLMPVSIYTDVGLGIYSIKYGDYQQTLAGNPTVTDNFKYSSVTQFGFSAGAGVNISTSPFTILNFSVKYHNVLKKTGVTFVESHTQTVNGVSSTTSTSNPYDIAERGYVQFSLGFGVKLGM